MSSSWTRVRYRSDSAITIRNIITVDQKQITTSACCSEYPSGPILALIKLKLLIIPPSCETGHLQRQNGDAAPDNLQFEFKNAFTYYVLLQMRENSLAGRRTAGEELHEQAKRACTQVMIVRQIKSGTLYFAVARWRHKRYYPSRFHKFTFAIYGRW